jgi:hypothetical protein
VSASVNLLNPSFLCLFSLLLLFPLGGGLSQDFFGVVEEMRLWRTARSAEQIREGMAADDGRGPGEQKGKGEERARREEGIEGYRLPKKAWLGEDARGRRRERQRDKSMLNYTLLHSLPGTHALALTCSLLAHALSLSSPWPLQAALMPRAWTPSTPTWWRCGTSTRGRASGPLTPLGMGTTSSSRSSPPTGRCVAGEGGNGGEGEQRRGKCMPSFHTSRS